MGCGGDVSAQEMGVVQMRIQLPIPEEPEIDSIRTKEKFLFIPRVTKDGIIVWLETIEVTEAYYFSNAAQACTWHELSWRMK